LTVRADFTGGEMSSDLGTLMLGAVDRRIGLIDRLTGAIVDARDARYITPLAPRFADAAGFSDRLGL
jgi:hypothetical protein